MAPASHTHRREPRVDAYISALPGWQQRICQRLRDLIHATDAEIEETIKRSVQPYFVLNGNVCALLAAKDHVNLFLYDGAIVPDPEGIITGGHNNKTARTISFKSEDEINDPALTAMLAQIIANNRAGGWRRLKVGAQGGAEAAGPSVRRKVRAQSAGRTPPRVDERGDKADDSSDG